MVALRLSRIPHALLLVVSLVGFVRAPLHGQSVEFAPVTDAMLQNPSAEDWLMWRRTLNGWGYSPLDQIDRGNVGQLQLVWSRGLGPGCSKVPRWATTA